jgi:hypothetical protein
MAILATMTHRHQVVVFHGKLSWNMTIVDVSVLGGLLGNNQNRVTDVNNTIRNYDEVQLKPFAKMAGLSILFARIIIWPHSRPQ